MLTSDETNDRFAFLERCRNTLLEGAGEEHAGLFGKDLSRPPKEVESRKCSNTSEKTATALERKLRSSV